MKLCCEPQISEPGRKISRDVEQGTELDLTVQEPHLFLPLMKALSMNEGHLQRILGLVPSPHKAPQLADLLLKDAFLHSLKHLNLVYTILILQAKTYFNNRLFRNFKIIDGLLLLKKQKN